MRRPRLRLNKKGQIVEDRLKHGNLITERDGIKFRSLGEADRYTELKLLQSGGNVTDLELQVPLELICNGEIVGTYIADFVYNEPFQDKVYYQRRVIEDFKGQRTRLFILKWNILKAMHKGDRSTELRLTSKASNRTPWSLRKIAALRRGAA